MTRKEKSEKSMTNPAPKKWTKVWAAAVALSAATLLVGMWFLSQNEPWSLPAVPRHPRPATLAPTYFTGAAARAYQIAREVPELLERIPCYCGCYKNPGHRNNLDCYTDRHGAG